MTDAEKMREAAALLSWADDEIVMRMYDKTRENARKMPREGSGRGIGMAGYAAEECGRWYLEAVRRGLLTRALPIPVDASATAADCQQAELVTVDAGLLDEVKAALRAAEDALADSQLSGGSAERRVSAALARLEREVG